MVKPLAPHPPVYVLLSPVTVEPVAPCLPPLPTPLVHVVLPSIAVEPVPPTLPAAPMQVLLDSTTIEPYTPTPHVPPISSPGAAPVPELPVSSTLARLPPPPSESPLVVLESIPAIEPALTLQCLSRAVHHWGHGCPLCRLLCVSTETQHPLSFCTQPASRVL